MAVSRIRLRRGTAAQWAAAAPILAAGEVGVDLDTGELRVGDGTTAWASLVPIGGVSPEAIEAAVDAYLTANPPAGSYAPASHWHTLDAVTDTATRVAMTPAERTKLSGVATGATANASDAQLRDRSTHTGTQAAASIADLTEAVQDAVGAMVTAAGGTYDDAAGTITLPSGGATRGLIITDTNVGAIPDGDAEDTLAAYYNSGASPITVQGTSIAAGAHAVWAWVSGAWTLLASGTGGDGGEVVLSAPSVSIDSVTHDSITAAYSTSTPDAASWQYRLDGGTVGALDGASPDTISGLSPLQSGTIEVRYAVGAVWSPWSAPVAWQTSALTLSWLQLPTTANVTETWDAENGYTYTWAGSATPAKLIAQAGQDFQIQFRVAGIGESNAEPKVQTSRSTGSVLGNAAPFGLVVSPSAWWIPLGGQTVQISWQLGDMWRWARTGSVWSLHVSADTGATWTLMASYEVGNNWEHAFFIPQGAAGLVLDRIQYAASGVPLTVLTPEGPVAVSTDTADTIRIPNAPTGMTYQIDGAPVTGVYTAPTRGQTVTVMPVAQTGYCIFRNLLPAGWSYAFTTDALPANASALPAPASMLTSDAFARGDGAPGAADLAYGGTARTWTVNTAGTAIASGALSVTGNGATISGWTSASTLHALWDVVSTDATWQVVVFGSLNFRRDASGNLSLLYVYQAGTPFVIYTLMAPISLGASPGAGTYGLIVNGRVVLVSGPSGTSRIILPYTIFGGNTWQIKAIPSTDTYGAGTEVGDLLIDNVKIGIPA